MILFKPIELSDKEWIDEILHVENSRSADYCFSNMFMWSRYFNPHVCRCENRITIRLQTPEKMLYSFPVGSGDLAGAVDKLSKDAEILGIRLTIRGITEINRTLLENSYPDRFEFTPETNSFDYVYSAEKLATLSGKKLHAKRNHINRFIEAGDWSFEPLNELNVSECMKVYKSWEDAKEDTSGYGFQYEQAALEIALRNFRFFGFVGGLLRKGGKVIAFTIGEKLSSDTFVVHFEKAVADIQGSFAMINREFVRHVLILYPEIKYINREEDMGNENLRKAKRAYYPEFMIEKYIAVERRHGG